MNEAEDAAVITLVCDICGARGRGLYVTAVDYGMGIGERTLCWEHFQLAMEEGNRDELN